jgi:hypothetical protein
LNDEDGFILVGGVVRFHFHCCRWPD